jgi:hypothetical protein
LRDSLRRSVAAMASTIGVGSASVVMAIAPAQRKSGHGRKSTDPTAPWCLRMRATPVSAARHG